MTRWTTTDMPDLTGRTVIITGASSGLGLITASEMARAHARVVLAVRDPAKGARVAAELPGITEVRQLDVADLGSVHRFAEGWHDRIDVLINNAGIMDVPFARTADGFERQVATNYLGPFLLTNLLLPNIRDRVVSVTSQLHRRGTVHLDDLPGTGRPYRSGQAYEDAKMALTLFALELQRRLAAVSSPVRSVLAHPGIASTTLARHATSGKVTHALRFLFNDPQTGAESILFAATQGIPGGSYVGPRGLGGLKGHPALSHLGAAARNETLARELWERTAELTALDTDRSAWV